MCQPSRSAVYATIDLKRQPLRLALDVIRAFEDSLIQAAGLDTIPISTRDRPDRISLERWEDEDYVYLGATVPDDLPSMDLNCEGRSILIRVARADLSA